MTAPSRASATSSSEAPGREETLAWLREGDPARLEALWRRADAVRRARVGDAVHLRGLIEVSNHCARMCHYCGIRAGNAAVARYRMGHDEVLACARQARDLGYGTVVLQAGEDPGLTRDAVTAMVRAIKAETGLAVTLSLGERPEGDLLAWRAAGADRYLMRFETSNPALFAAIHPAPAGRPPVDRPALLRALGRMGYEVGSGVMVGIPGQTYADLADDLALMAELELDMIGIGPYLPHPATPLAGAAPAPADQAPNTELMTYKMVALARLYRPGANLPSTTALATLNLASGRELGLRRGANVIMPNLTPVQYKALYEIYPAKACVRETADQCHACLGVRIKSVGRIVGQGPGASASYAHRMQASA